MTISTQHTSHMGPEPIAIVGAGCWLPGDINSIDQLYAALLEGRDLVTDIPPDRWLQEDFFDPDPIKPGKTYVRRGGFVRDIDQFDAGFFGISDAEASRMDPQQRMILQTVWHALEHAGQSPDDLANTNTGVFLAMMNTNNYSQIKAYFEGVEGLTAYDAMGDAMSIAGGRVAHFLGLEGPTLSLDTACSSSLVAVHLARQSILSGESDAAIVVGVNAILHPGIHITFSKIGLMSRAGRCAAFDADADGYIRGEGCVAVVLRRESEAIARGDHIMASIVGTAINQDGRTPAVTAPNGRAQEKVIRSALARVGVDPREIGYVEAHGTGTPVGDPIEMSAIVNVFGPDRMPDEKLFVGSVKSNFGHIEAGAGLLGLVKAALSIEHNVVFPTVHFKQLNPNIDLGHAPVEVPTFPQAWPERAVRRMAGVNSFGYSGTNAHAILQQAPIRTNTPASEKPDRPGELVLLSAKTQASLEDLADRWLEYLESTEDPLSDIAFTSVTGRAHLNHRIAIAASSREEVMDRLKAWREGRISKGLASGQTRFRIKTQVAFMFTGQGAQYAGMGRELYRKEARFAATIDEIAEIMNEELDVSLVELLFGPDSERLLQNTRYVQPAMFAVEYALADLLRYWGVEPDYLIGHSVGEISAACFGGMLDLEDAVRFVVARGRLMGSLPEGGKMLALGADLEQARAWIKGMESEISIATVNAPQSVVVSGTAEAVEAVQELAIEAGRRSKELDVSHAFHSPLMSPILEELAEIAGTMRVRPARIPVISNVSGQYHNGEVKGAYWSDHVREAVLFHDGIKRIVDDGATLLVEIGPHPALIPAVATSFDANTIRTVPTLRRDGNDISNLLNALALMFVLGTSLDLDRLFWSTAYQRVDLPLYPFRRDKHWLSNIEKQFVRIEPAGTVQLADLPELHPLLGEAIERTPRQTVFEVTLSTISPWTDHRVLGKTVFPGTGYLEMAARGFTAISGLPWQAVELLDISFERPLLLAYRKPKVVRLRLAHTPNGQGHGRFTIFAADNESEVYCQGRVGAVSRKQEKAMRPEYIRGDAPDMSVGQFYGDLRTIGLEYGAKFANVREIWVGNNGSGRATGRISYARFGDQAGDHFSNAVLLDSCLHVFGPALRAFENDHLPGAYVPAGVTSLSLFEKLPIEFWSEVHVKKSDDRAALVDIHVFNDKWKVIALFEEVELRRTDTLSTGPLAAVPSSLGFTGLGAKSRAELIDLLKPLDKRRRINELSRWLTAEIKDTLGQAAEGMDIESLPPSTAFLEIGLDSLLVTELQRRIQEKLEFRFKPMQGLDYQSIESMAEYLHDEVLTADLIGQQV